MNYVRILRIRHDRTESQGTGRQEAPPKEVRTLEQRAAYLAERTAHILENAARRQVSPAFDAPQFCQDWIDLATRTTRATRLRIMVRDVKVDKKGKPVLNKRTKAPVMAWRPYENR